MFKFSDLKQLHLEISNNCQASCPMCNRNHHGGIANPHLKITNWTLNEFKQIINQEVLDQIDGIYLCGNFGDPLLNEDLVEICDYVKNNSDIFLRIHTNGSLRNIKWWETLAQHLPKSHLVVFALDGLVNTHSRYRIGTDFNKIIDNATAFIKNGGTAEWSYIVFEHNEHQVDEARSLAKNIGFHSFAVKHSSRFVGSRDFNVLDKNGNTVDVLRPASNSVIKILDKSVLDNYKKIIAESEIDCNAIKIKEVYIDAHKVMMPCCFLASTPYNYTDPNSAIVNIRQEIALQYNNLFNDLKNPNTMKRSLKEIINSEEYQTVWEKYWHTDKLITCVRTCGKNNFSKPFEQFVKKEEIK